MGGFTESRAASIALPVYASLKRHKPEAFLAAMQQTWDSTDSMGSEIIFTQGKVL
jgi:hypothetical protein